MQRAAMALALALSSLAGWACSRETAAEARASHANREFQDKMREIARLSRVNHDDDKIRRALMKAAFEHERAPFIAERQFVIETAERRRRIVCDYERRIELSAGRTRTLRFTNEVDEPLSW